MELMLYLKELVVISVELETTIDHAFARDVFPKRHKLFLPDHESRRVFFIEQGLARIYYLKPDGKDVTHHFFVENSFSMAFETIFYGRPSPYGLELLETSVVRSIQYDALEKIINQHYNLEKLMRLLLVETLKTFSDRLYALQFQSAQDRYNTLLENDIPPFCNGLPWAISLRIWASPSRRSASSEPSASFLRTRPIF